MLQQLFKVVAEAFRITGNIDQPPATECGKWSSKAGSTLPWRVEDYAVILLVVSGQLKAGIVNRHFLKAAVFLTGPVTVFAGAPDGRSLALYAQDGSCFLCKSYGEVAHSTEDIKDAFIICNRRESKNRFNEFSVLVQIYLTESSGFQRELQKFIGVGKKWRQGKGNCGAACDAETAALEEYVPYYVKVANKICGMLSISGSWLAFVVEQDADCGIIRTEHDFQCFRLLEEPGEGWMRQELFQTVIYFRACQKAALYGNRVVAAAFVKAGCLTLVNLKTDALPVMAFRL